MAFEGSAIAAMQRQKTTMIDQSENCRPPLLEGRGLDRLEARLLIKSIEGTEAPMAYGLAGNRPFMKAKGIELGAPVDPQLLIDFLRSDRPISRTSENGSRICLTLVCDQMPI